MGKAINKRKDNRAKIRTRKQAGMLKPGKKSKYALKHDRKRRESFVRLLRSILRLQSANA